MKLAFSTLGCPDWPLDTVIGRAKEYGFDGVDFRGCAGQMDLWMLPEFSSRLAETARRIHDAGLEVPCLSTSGRLLVKTEGERGASTANMDEFAKIGSALGAKKLRVFGGHNGERSYDEALKEAAATLDDMARRTARFGITVLVETHDDWIASDKVLDLLHAATEPNVGAIWDINHPFRMANETPQQTWDVLGPHVQYVHVKDTHKLADGKSVPCLLGQGEVPVAETVRVLRGGGYGGWYTYEWEKKWHPEIEDADIAFPQYVNFMREL